MTEIQIKHFQDAQHGEVAPLTPEAAIYDANGVRLDVKLSAVQPEVISSNLSAATQAISELAETCVERIQSEADACTNSIDNINRYLFPMEPEFAVLLDSGNTYCVTNYRIKAINKNTHQLEDIVADRVTVDFKGANDAEYTNLIDDSGTTTGTSACTIEDSVQEYRLVAEKEGLTTVQIDKKLYFCAYGASSAETMDVDTFEGLEKVMAKGISSMPSVTTANGEYIWIVIPEELSINRVVCSGFDVSMNTPETFTVTDDDYDGIYKGVYKAYRSTNALDDATWKLMLN